MLLDTEKEIVSTSFSFHSFRGRHFTKGRALLNKMGIGRFDTTKQMWQKRVFGIGLRTYCRISFSAFSPGLDRFLPLLPNPLPSDPPPPVQESHV